jgi:hypothetical protein
VKDHKSLQTALQKMLNDDNLWVLNVLIDPRSDRKPQEFNWLTSSEDKKTEEPEMAPKL